MVYMGSKAALVSELGPILQSHLVSDSQWYIECFMGGGNMISMIDHPCAGVMTTMIFCRRCFRIFSRRSILMSVHVSGAFRRILSPRRYLRRSISTCVVIRRSFRSGL